MSIADMKRKIGSALCIIVSALLVVTIMKVYAQTQTDTISTPQELTIDPYADSAAVRATPTELDSDPLDIVSIGLNFQGSELFADSGFIPPDTMGAVGPDHIGEMINGRFDVYSKADGSEVFTRSLDGFWTDVVGLPGGGTFDPRIVFDLASGRWFATSIDGSNGNNIYLARSDNDDPTGGWQGVLFAADTIFPAEFHDYDTLSVDADGVYICTNDFGSFGNESCYSIPKADLLLSPPSINRLTRFEATPPGLPNVTGSIQPALDFGPSDGRAALLGISFSGTLVRSDVLGASGAGASLGTITAIQGAPVTAQAPPARQPHPFDPSVTIENVSPRIVSSVFEQGDSLWAVHAVLGSLGNSAIRWYEIDEVTNNLLQTGLIENANQDFFDPSIAVNEFDDVVIGYTCSGPSLSPSACVSVGETDNGVTNFENPLLLQQGAGYYYRVFNGSRNRWGDYSATVIDPVDPCTFWTFQEFVAVSAIGDVGPGRSQGGSWGIQVTELTFNNCVGQSRFVDVPPGSFAEEEIYKIFNAGITAGCSKSPLKYCPSSPVTRSQMAIFLLKSKLGSGYTPPPATGIFDDVPVGSFAEPWIEDLYNRGITVGCQKSPLRYCPSSPVTRSQMAIFLLKTKLGSGYRPPPATGIFDDVPVGSFREPWIEDLYNRGITVGCQKSPLRFCPDSSATRAQMAIFIVRTFNL
jgi:hypothetical protein